MSAAKARAKITAWLDGIETDDETDVKLTDDEDNALVDSDMSDASDPESVHDDGTSEDTNSNRDDDLDDHSDDIELTELTANDRPNQAAVDKSPVYTSKN